MRGKDVAMVFILVQACIFRYSTYIFLFVSVLPLPTCTDRELKGNHRRIGSGWWILLAFSHDCCHSLIKMGQNGEEKQAYKTC